MKLISREIAQCINWGIVVIVVLVLLKSWLW